MVIFHKPSVKNYLHFSLGAAGLSRQSSTASLKRQMLREQTEAGHEPDLLRGLFQSRTSDAGVVAFLSYVTRYMQLHNMALPMHFAPDHPVEEVGRWVTRIN